MNLIMNLVQKLILKSISQFIEEEDNASLSSLGRGSTHRTPLNGQNRQDLALNLSNIIGQGPPLNGKRNRFLFLF